VIASGTAPDAIMFLVHSATAMLEPFFGFILQYDELQFVVRARAFFCVFDPNNSGI